MDISSTVAIAITAIAVAALFVIGIIALARRSDVPSPVEFVP
jgi:hypothetical protein